MLRHLRIAPPTKAPLRQSDTHLLGLLLGWIRPLLDYRVPYSISRRHHACTCRYPLFTLRSSQPSLYDEPAPLDACFASSPVLRTPVAATTTITSPAGASPASSSGPSTAANSGVSTPIAVKKTLASPSLISSTFLSSLRHGRWLARRGRTTSLPCATHYRCDICNGYRQPSSPPFRTPTNAANSAESACPLDQTCGRRASTSAASPTTAVAAAGEQDDDRYGPATATEIANTVMEEREVAELRYVDPFHVEVLGRFSWASLTSAALREIRGQLRRAGLTAADLAQCGGPVTRKSESYRRQYRLWVRRGCQDQQATLQCGASRADVLQQQIATLRHAAYLVRYAVAAYGLPYELNYFSSIRAMAKLMYEPHQRYICANSEEQLESMRRMLHGGDSPALLECVSGRYSIQTGQSCYSLFLDHEAKRVVLTFRGSLTPADIVVDTMEGYAILQFQQQQAPPEAEESRCMASGEAKAVPLDSFTTAVPLGFYKSVVEAAPQLLTALQTIHGQYPSYDLAITGHSLGGIEASLFHLCYCGEWRVTLQGTSSVLKRRPLKPVSVEDGDRSPTRTDEVAIQKMAAGSEGRRRRPIRFSKVVTCTFGSAPMVESRVMPILDSWLAAAEQRTGSRLISISHGMDCVSRLQVASLKDLLSMQRPLQSGNSTLTTEAGGLLNPLRRWVQGSAKSSTTPLSSSLAVASLVTDERSLPLLVLPGDCYNITAGLRRPYLLPIAADAKETRQQLILTSTSVIQHFPALYLRGVNEALKHYTSRWKQLQVSTVLSSPSSPSSVYPAKERKFLPD